MPAITANVNIARQRMKQSNSQILAFWDRQKKNLFFNLVPCIILQCLLLITPFETEKPQTLQPFQFFQLFADSIPNVAAPQIIILEVLFSFPFLIIQRTEFAWGTLG